MKILCTRGLKQVFQFEFITLARPRCARGSRDFKLGLGTKLNRFSRARLPALPVGGQADALRGRSNTIQIVYHSTENRLDSALNEHWLGEPRRMGITRLHSRWLVTR